jgi:hypothetical protein
MIFRLSLILLSFAVPAAQASGPLNLRDGEKLVFRVAWGPFSNAGTITIAANEEELEGLGQTRVTTVTSTRGVVRALYPFDGRVDSIFDLRSGKMLAAYANTSAKRKQVRASMVFNYEEGVGHYVDAVRPERSTEVEIPTDFPMDLITSMINSRSWDIEVGDKRPLSVLFDDEFYELEVTAEGVENIATAWGRQDALLLIPRMEVNPKGMFRRGGSVRIWLSQTNPRLPLRLEVSVAVGTAVAMLTEYQPKATAAETARHARPDF